MNSTFAVKKSLLLDTLSIGGLITDDWSRAIVRLKVFLEASCGVARSFNPKLFNFHNGLISGTRLLRTQLGWKVRSDRMRPLGASISEPVLEGLKLVVQSNLLS